MRALDTNVLVRYFAQDDPKQSARAARLLEKELTTSDRGFVTLVALLETVWVMESRYSASTELVSDILEDLLNTATLDVQDAPAVRAALLPYRAGGVDLHDCLIVALADARKARVVTFDAKAAKRLGMELLR
jgi:predicted nucleic-acid-binding protein